MKLFKRIITGLLIVVLLAVGGFFIYASQYYHESNEVIEEVESFPKKETINNMTIFYPDEINDRHSAILFYPGGKVAAMAYAPLMMSFAKQGYTVVLFEMPFNLAVFEINTASQAFDYLEGIDHWYMMGHSLGGAMASTFAKSHDQIEGLILLGAYPIGTPTVPTLIIYGEHDGVINRKKLEAFEPRIMIPGGNHAYFGNYGPQKGDGVATITPEKQQEETVYIVDGFIYDLNPRPVK